MHQSVIEWNLIRTVWWENEGPCRVNNISSHQQIFTNFPVSFLHSSSFVALITWVITWEHTTVVRTLTRGGTTLLNIISTLFGLRWRSKRVTNYRHWRKKCQPHRETRMKCLKHRLNTLTELVSTLVMALGQNATNMAPAIPLGILLTNAKGEEAQPSQVDGDAMASEEQTETCQCLRCAQHIRRNVARPTQEDREPTPESHQIERTRDLVFNRLEWPTADPNMDNDYDFEFDYSISSRGNADLCD